MSAIQYCDVDRIRLQLPALVLPAPARVAAEAEASHIDSLQCASAPGSGIRDWRGASAAWLLERPELRTVIRGAMAALSRPSAAPPAHSAADAHDAYFRIVRTQSAEPTDYLRGVITGLDLFLQEVACAAELRDYDTIGIALLDLWFAALGESSTCDRGVPHAGMQQRAPDPVRRWVRGHQVFAVLTQGLIWTLHRFDQASRHDDEAALRDALRRMTRLYRASAAAFRFTADFDPSAYERSIRPSMSEPHLPAGFSGTLSLDHRHLVRGLASLREPLAGARQRCPDDYRRMTEALAQVYDDHKWVCARFTGASASSLLTGSLGGDRSASETLDRFKARRIGHLS